MWIKGTIRLNTSITENELLGKFPRNEAELSEGSILIETDKIPFFADHTLVLSLVDRDLFYRLSVPSLGPLILFMFLAVVFLAGFTGWETLVVGGIIATGSAFAIYVINDKGARSYIQRHINKLEADEELAEKISPQKEGSCPACGTYNSPYSKSCISCGLHLKSKKVKSMQNHTSSKAVKLKYRLKK